MKLLPDSIISHGVAKGLGGAFEGTCRICGPTRFSSFAVKEGFNLSRCEQCRAVQITDDLSNVRLEEYYDKHFFHETYDWLEDEEGSGRRKEYQKFHFRMDEIERLKPEKGRILDVGCSYGFFLDVARSRGWQTVGIDVGEHAVSFARERLGLEVHVCDLAAVPLEPGTIDVVTMWNVVEHLPEPVTELRRIHKLLTPGGLIVFTTGNVDSYIRRVQGLRWRMFIPPIHVVNFSATAIPRLLDKSGFDLEVRSVALPREALLRRMGLIGLLRGLKFSDKMLIFARKRSIA